MLSMKNGWHSRSRTVTLCMSIHRMRAVLKHHKIPSRLTHTGPLKEGSATRHVWHPLRKSTTFCLRLAQFAHAKSTQLTGGIKQKVVKPQSINLEFQNNCCKFAVAIEVQDVSFVIQINVSDANFDSKTSSGAQLREHFECFRNSLPILLPAREGAPWRRAKRKKDMDHNKKHERPISLRLTEDEFTAIRRRIDTLAQNDGSTQRKLSFSAGVRLFLWNAVSVDIQEQPRRPLIDAELARDIRGEVHKIGLNVNQLAKNMNAVLKKGESASRSTETKLIGSLDMVCQHLDDILARLNELS